MNAIGFIFARGGSKGVPRKNLRLLAGKPLLAHAIEAARQSRYIRRVVVSTEDDEIARVAEDYGAEVPFRRPAELASDTAAEWLAWQHAIRAVSGGERPNFEMFVSVPATAPLRAPQDIDAAIELLRDSGADAVIAVTEAHRNPYFNMLILDEQGRARIAMAGQTGQKAIVPPPGRARSLRRDHRGLCGPARMGPPRQRPASRRPAGHCGPQGAGSGYRQRTGSRNR